MKLKLVSYNVRGINDPKKRSEVFGLLTALNADIVFLQETYTAELNISEINDDWQGTATWHHGPHKHANGVGILFNKHLNYQTLTTLQDTVGRRLILTIQIANTTLQLANIYAPTNAQERPPFFSNTANDLNANIPTILAGDFNMTTHPEIDRTGSTTQYYHIAGRTELLAIIANLDLTDSWRKHHPQKLAYTYRSNDYTKQSRLDRIYTPSHLKITESEIIPFHHSDHEPVLTTTHITQHYNPNNAVWKLNTSILPDDHTEQTINDIISFHLDKKERFKSTNSWWEHIKQSCTNALKSIAKNNAKARRLQFQQITHELSRLKNTTNPNKRRIETLQQQYNDHLQYKLKGSEIRAKIQLQLEEERPTAFFFQLEQHKKTKTLIHTLKNEQNETISDPAHILAHITQFYTNLYRKPQLDITAQTALLNKLSSKLSDDLYTKLNSEITQKEINEAIDNMDNNKSPGDDGLPAEFYKHFKTQLAPILTTLYNTIIETEHNLPHSMTNAIITLIPKKGDPSDIKNWRPISLLNVDYKIFTKILATRLRTTLTQIIDSTQTCAVPNRTIHQNNIFLRDLILLQQNHHSSLSLISIDFEKAFDKVDRLFTFKTLEAFHFPPKFIQTIQTLYKTTTAQIKQASTLSHKFPLDNGLRQGCPLSLPLFVVVAQTLTTFLNTDPSIPGIVIPGIPMKIKTSQYADDALLLNNTLMKLDHTIDKIKTFKTISNLGMNDLKTTGMHFRQQPPPTTNHITWSDHKTPFKILGINYHKDYNLTIRSTYTSLITKAKRKIQTLQARHLSLKGKAQLINTLITSIFGHASNVLPVPNYIQTSFENLIFPFLWSNRTPEPIARKTIYLPIKRGGLGLIHLQLQNRALLTKHLLAFTFKSETDFSSYGPNYWCRTRLALMHTRWAHMMRRPGPQNFLDEPPEPYKLALDIIKNLPPKILTSPTTKNIYQHLLQEHLKHHEIKGKTKWQTLIRQPLDWEKMIQLAYTSYNPPLDKDIYFKLLHHATPTKYHIASHSRNNLPTIRNNCPTCQRPEKLLHCFIYCPRNGILWTLALKLLRLVTNNKTLSPLNTLTLHDIPPMILTQRKLYTTILTTTVATIWRARNHDLTNQQATIEPETLRTNFRKEILTIINTRHKYHSKQKTLPLFKAFFCKHPEIATLNEETGTYTPGQLLQDDVNIIL